MEKGKILSINGPVVIGKNMAKFKLREMVLVGEKKLIGEVVKIENDLATIQIYEETTGLKRDEEIISTGSALSVKLGPGIISNIFDGIQRPLEKIKDKYGNFIPEGIGLISLDEEKLWQTKFLIKKGDHVEEGQIIATVQETEIIEHKILVPIGVEGEVVEVLEDGSYNIETVIAKVKTNKGEIKELKMYQNWPVRIPRPIKERKPIRNLLSLIHI